MEDAAVPSHRARLLETLQTTEVKVSPEEMSAYTRSLILNLIRMNSGVAGREQFVLLLRQSLKYI